MHLNQTFRREQRSCHRKSSLAYFISLCIVLCSIIAIKPRPSDAYFGNSNCYCHA